jgi:hypothetical protein
MAQKRHTRSEIAGQMYLKIVDIRILLDCSQAAARKIYQLADRLDDEELGDYRIEPRKVRMTSICKVTNTSLQTINKLIKNAHPEG